MSLFDFLKELFRPAILDNNRHFIRHKRRHKFVKPSVCNVLEVDVGTYVSDGGGCDYGQNYKVKRGKVLTKCIRHMKKNEDTNMFNTLKLTPITNSAYLLVIKSYLGANSGSYEVSRILLRKQQKGKKPRIIQI